MLNKNRTTKIERQDKPNKHAEWRSGTKTPSKLEVQLAIEKLNNNKAPRLDGTPEELLKYGGQEILNKTTN